MTCFDCKHLLPRSISGRSSPQLTTANISYNYTSHLNTGEVRAIVGLIWAEVIASLFLINACIVLDVLLFACKAEYDRVFALFSSSAPLHCRRCCSFSPRDSQMIGRQCYSRIRSIRQTKAQHVVPACIWSVHTDVQLFFAS